MMTAARAVARVAAFCVCLMSAGLLGRAAPVAGTWTPLANLAPDFTGTMLLLTDGSVMVQGYDPGDNWMRLAPDASGSYVQGTWSNLARMSTPRLYFASHVLQSGKVWVLGGEYVGDPLVAAWSNTGEIYDPVTNAWTPIAHHPQRNFGDDPSMLVPGGKILAGSIFGGTSYLYDIASNTWSPAGHKAYDDSSDEEGWVKLAGGSVLTYDIFKSVASGGSYAETYNPATNMWSSISPSDGTANGFIPQLSSEAVGYELGPLVRLHDGRIFIIGATGHTALYDPGTNTWTAGPDVMGSLDGQPALFGADDAPAAVLPSGHVLFTADAGPGPEVFSPPTQVFEFAPESNTILPVQSPTPDLDAIPAFVTRMLVLPTGQVLFSDSDTQLWVYTPTGSAPNLLKPRVEGVKYNGGGVFTLTGQQLNGQSAGSNYGDDVESDENYPIVSLVDKAGHVFYARTTNWSSTGVGTQVFRETVNFTLPSTLTNPGVYKVSVSGAGISSVAAVAVNLTADQIAGS